MDRPLTYDVWKDDHLPYLQKIAGRRAAVTFSAGKDSSIILYFMVRAAKEFGFVCEAHGAAYPHHVLDEAEQQRFVDFWRDHGIEIVWHTVATTDSELDEALECGTNPCGVCNRAKKAALMAEIGKTAGSLEDLVLVMGYSLWDLTSATLENILNSCARSEDGPESAARERRLLETAQRFYPWLQFDGGPSIFKPLLLYNDQTITRAIEEYRIPVGRNECRHKLQRPKRRFAEYYSAVGLEFDFEKVRDLWQKTLPLPPAAQFEAMGSAAYLGTRL
jgi:tRNA(Ile)-lysidine synthase TilS/MesJ